MFSSSNQPLLRVSWAAGGSTSQPQALDTVCFQWATAKEKKKSKERKDTPLKRTLIQSW
jgi:hypothetical protein